MIHIIKLNVNDAFLKEFYNLCLEELNLPVSCLKLLNWKFVNQHKFQQTIKDMDNVYPTTVIKPYSASLVFRMGINSTRVYILWRANVCFSSLMIRNQNTNTSMCFVRPKLFQISHSKQKNMCVYSFISIFSLYRES